MPVHKPAEGSWTAHYPEISTAPMSYEDSISPEIHELEREAIFKRFLLQGREPRYCGVSVAEFFASGMKSFAGVLFPVRQAFDDRTKQFGNRCFRG